MKLDLNKPWILKLVNQNSTVNGCSFIRGVILRTIWTAFLWVAGVALGSLVCMALIGGAYMWFHEPTYFLSGYPDRLLYFGESWMAYSWALLSFLGGLCWAVAIAAGIVGGIIYGMVQGLTASSPTIATITGKVWKAITPSENFQEAVSAWYHKFCPEIEIILPKGYEGYVVGARVAKRDVSWTDDDEQVITWPEGTIMRTELKGNHLGVYILWDASVDFLNKHYDDPTVQAEFDTPEELEQERQDAICERWTWNDRHIWFGGHDPDDEFKLLVEENDSPQ